MQVSKYYQNWAIIGMGHLGRVPPGWWRNDVSSSGWCSISSILHNLKGSITDAKQNHPSQNFSLRNRLKLTQREGKVERREKGAVLEPTSVRCESSREEFYLQDTTFFPAFFLFHVYSTTVGWNRVPSLNEKTGTSREV